MPTVSDFPLFGMNIPPCLPINLPLLQAVQFDSLLGGQSSVIPLEMPLDISPLYATDAEIMDLWTDYG